MGTRGIRMTLVSAVAGLALCACGSQTAQQTLSLPSAPGPSPYSASDQSVGTTRPHLVDLGFCVGYDNFNDLLEHADVVVRAQILPNPELTTEEEFYNRDQSGESIPMAIWAVEVREVLHGKVTRKVLLPRHDLTKVDVDDEAPLPVGRDLVLVLAERMGYFNPMCEDQGLAELDSDGSLHWHLGSRDPSAFPATYEALQQALR